MDRRLRVHIKRHCEYSERENVEYGSHHASYSNYFQGVTIGEKYDEPVPFDVKEGDPVFVVWAEWSTGDSFGRDINGRTEILAIFKTAEKAIAAREDFLKDGEDKYSCEYVDEAGEKKESYRGWVGYFEDLTDIHVSFAQIGR